MKRIDTTKTKAFFKPLIASRSVQAAMMVLKHGQSSSEGVEDEHPRSEQWLLVLSGAGRATVGKQSLRLKPGSLLLIEKAEPHRITNDGEADLVTLNFYAPPAYTSSGNLKPAAKRKNASRG